MKRKGFDSSGLTVKDSASRRPLLRCDSTGPFTPFAFRIPLHHSRFLRLPPLPRRRLPPHGTAVLVTLAATFWLSSVVVPMFLVLGLLLSTSAMRASLVAMFDFPFLLLLRMQRMPLILFTGTCGHLLYSACLATNTIWSWSMISHTTLGLFLCAPSLRPYPPSSTSLPGCPLSSASPLRLSSVTTGVSSITPPPVHSSSLGVFSYVCLVCIPQFRTASLSG